MHSPSFPAARRMPGSNNYDEVLIDIPASFSDVREWLRARRPERVAGHAWLNRWKLGRSVIANRTPSWNALLGMPLHDPDWFGRFKIYWSQVLGGVKIDQGDFLYLRSIYRQKCEDNAWQARIGWADTTSHLANWQQPANLFHTLHFAFKDSRVPVKGGASLARRTFAPGKRVLEFGCALAPMYAIMRASCTGQTVRANACP